MYMSPVVHVIALINNRGHIRPVPWKIHGSEKCFEQILAIHTVS